MQTQLARMAPLDDEIPECEVAEKIMINMEEQYGSCIAVQVQQVNIGVWS